VSFSKTKRLIKLCYDELLGCSTLNCVKPLNQKKLKNIKLTSWRAGQHQPIPVMFFQRVKRNGATIGDMFETSAQPNKKIAAIQVVHNYILAMCILFLEELQYVTSFFLTNQRMHKYNSRVRIVTHKNT